MLADLFRFINVDVRCFNYLAKTCIALRGMRQTAVTSPDADARESRASRKSCIEASVGSHYWALANAGWRYHQFANFASVTARRCVFFFIFLSTLGSSGDFPFFVVFFLGGGFDWVRYKVHFEQLVRAVHGCSEFPMRKWQVRSSDRSDGGNELSWLHSRRKGAGCITTDV